MPQTERIPEIPALLGELLEKQYGAAAERIRAGYAARRAVTLRANTLKSSPEEVRQVLTEAGIAFRGVPWLPEALLLPGAREAEVQALPLYQAGGVYLQSLSAMVPALALAPQPGEDILDMCAAPGGKTTQMAAMTGNRAIITACERDRARCERLRHNLSLQGASRVGVLQRDARTLEDFLSFDRILLDAPCSGSGTVSLLPGAPQRQMTPDWLRKLCRTQSALLRKALTLLRPGHELVYATCSVLRCENEDVIGPVLASGEAELVPLTGWTDLPLLPVSVPGTLCIAPTEAYEGFFTAKLRRK